MLHKSTLVFCITLLSVFWNNHSYSQDFLKDTSALKGNASYCKYNQLTIKANYDDSWRTNTYHYNKAGFCSIINRSSSYFGKDHNRYYRVYDESEKRCLTEYYIQDYDTLGRYEFSYSTLDKPDQMVINKRGKHYSTFYYEYNERGLLIREFVAIQESADTIFRYFKYDKNGRLISESETTQRTKKLTTWRYDDQGRLIEECLNDSSWVKHQHYAEDENGNMVKVRTEDYTSKPFTGDNYKATFVYNDQGQVLKRISTDLEGKIRSIFTYTYNQNGDKIQKKGYFMEDGKKQKRNYTYSYQYDSHGNWIWKETTLKRKVYENETRKIYYYRT